MTGPIRVGVGGWEFEPWRGSFFPPGLPRTRQLAFSSQVFNALEVNSTFYKTQKPETFRRWAAETPDGFVFTLKAPRYVVSRRVLAESGEGIARFLDSGITELGGKLGPILWQLALNRTFNEGEIAGFLSLLPASFDGQPLQHALEVRHPSFVDTGFIALARSFGVPIVYADSDTYPAIADPTGPFVYARLQRCSEAEARGYSEAALGLWAERARIWSTGLTPKGLNRVGSHLPGATSGQSRPVFIFFISGEKVRAPMAAQSLLRLLA